MPDSRTFHTIKINKWSDISNYRYENWIYRGQQNADWKLESSLERTCWRINDSLLHIKKVERKLIREFRRRFFQYRSHVRNEEDVLEWLSIMQHFGAPTRLLDFTYSIYIAAYFALEYVGKKENAAIWCINTKWCLKESASLFKNDSDEYKYILNVLDDKSWEAFYKTFFSDNPNKFACSVNPYRMNERLTLQKGVFMCTGDVESSFETNLLALNDSKNKSNIIKLIIPGNIRNTAVEELRDMNINRATLFPGLDGFAKSLQVDIPPALEYLSDN